MDIERRVREFLMGPLLRIGGGGGRRDEGGVKAQKKRTRESFQKTFGKEFKPRFHHKRGQQ